MQLLLEQHLTIPAHTLDLEYPKGVAGSAVPFHLHMFRQFWAGPAKNDLLIGAGCPATPSIRDFYERNVVEGAGAGAGGPTPFPCQKHHCACATKASFNAHLACRLAGFCFKYIFRPLPVQFLLVSFYILTLFRFFFIFILAIILPAAATEVALKGFAQGHRLSVICPRRSVVILGF